MLRCSRYNNCPLPHLQSTNMIEKATGDLKFASGIVIKSFISLEEVKSLGIGESQAESDMGNGWVWYHVKRLIVDGHCFNISFGFNRGKLLNLVFSCSKHTSDNRWESWSEKEELQKKILLDNWLNAEIGFDRTFNWGEAWTGYDTKGGFSSISLRYKN